MVTESEMKKADAVIRLRLVRPGDNYFEVVSNEVILATFDHFRDAVKYCEMNRLHWTDED